MASAVSSACRAPGALGHRNRAEQAPDLALGDLQALGQDGGAFALVGDAEAAAEIRDLVVFSQH